MTDKSIQVAAMIVDKGIITFYKLDGSVFTVTQGDPQGGAMSDEFLEQRRLGKEVITLTFKGDNDTSHHLTSTKRNPLIRFFKAKIADVVKLFGSNDSDYTSSEPSHEAAAAKVREICARLYKSDKDTGPEAVEDDPLPIKMVHSEGPLAKDETIIAVTESGVVPGVENLTDQFQAGAEGKAPAEGPDNLILRLANMSATRGHTAAELMKFIEKIDLPILPDGSFLAYKRLRHIGKGVYVDPHSGLVHQRIGDIVQMNESLVDKNRRQECSQGLHVGTRHYMGSFHANAEGSGTMLVLIQPEDVIAVPEYQTTKMRSCRYLILADLSNKAHGLVNQNKRMDDCKDTMQVVAQIVAGARPAMLGVVNIGGSKGSGLTYHIGNRNLPTNISLDDALAASQSKATAATGEVKDVRTIDDTANGNQSDMKPRKVRDKAHEVKPTEVKAKAEAPVPAAKPAEKQLSAREVEAKRLYTMMTNPSLTHLAHRGAAEKLKTMKKAHKVSWATLGLTAEIGEEVQALLDKPTTAAPKKSVPVSSKPQAKKSEPAKTAPQPSKTPAKPASGGTRQDKARRLWAMATDKNWSDLRKKEAAQSLRDFKKSAKVSWDALGLGKHNVEAELKKLLD
jgi:hypothetical protein